MSTHEDTGAVITALIRAEHTHDAVGSLALLDTLTRPELVSVIGTLVGMYASAIEDLCKQNDMPYQQLLDELPAMTDAVGRFFDQRPVVVVCCRGCGQLLTTAPELQVGVHAGCPDGR